MNFTLQALQEVIKGKSTQFLLGGAADALLRWVGRWRGTRASLLVLVGGVFFQRGDAAQAQARRAVRRGGGEHCVQEDQYEDAQLEPATAQSGRRGHGERRPVTGVPSLGPPSAGEVGLRPSPDVTAFGFIIGEEGFVEPCGDKAER